MSVFQNYKGIVPLSKPRTRKHHKLVDLFVKEMKMRSQVLMAKMSKTVLEHKQSK